MTLSLALVLAPTVTRTISVYGYPSDSSGPASGYICAVPHKGRKRDNRWEWPRGTKLRLTKGSRSVVVTVADVCNGRYWERRIDLPVQPYRALGGPKPYGLIEGVKVEVVR